MKHLKLALVGGIVAAMALVGTVFAWSPQATTTCNPDGSTKFVITLHLDGSTPGTYQIDTQTQRVPYTNGTVITLASTSDVTITEYQGDSHISQTFEVLVCPTPTPSPSPTPSLTAPPSPSAQPSPTTSTSPSPSTSPVPSLSARPSVVPTPPATSTASGPTSAGYTDLDLLFLFGGALIVGVVVAFTVSTLMYGRRR